MGDHEIYFDLIKQFNPNEQLRAKVVPVLLRNASRPVFLPRGDSRYATWSRWLTDALKDRQPVYFVVRKQEHLIDNIQVASLRRIDSLRVSDDKKQLNVGMLPSPSFYHVPITNPRYKDVVVVLRQALESKRQIYVVFGGGPLEITDALFPNPTWMQIP